MKSYDLLNFDNFIYACEGVLANAESDVIEYQDHFDKELWESKSFLFNKTFKTARRVWNDNRIPTLNDVALSKINIKHLILVEHNVYVEKHINAEIVRILSVYQEFERKYSLSRIDIMVKNQWFHELFKEIRKFEQWLTEIIRPEELKKIQGTFTFKNEFDDIHTDKVCQYFQKKLVESKMISEEELQLFLVSAFQNKKLLQTRISLKGNHTKNMVMKVFYLYYLDIAGKPHGRQKNYASLLGDYFQGYNTNNVSSNFSKTVY